MCGITGFVILDNKKPSLPILQKMTSAITYRGPDGNGVEISDNCALGNRRLAVIDLSAKAHQPMWDRQKRFCITYNGEVYNFPALRQLLLKKGYRFFSESDTEVVLNLYKEYGTASVSKLSGMFAYAIWDKKEHTLFVARDHFGIKPLYYYFKDGLFVFGSEIKAILAHPQVERRLNFEALSQYFSIGFGAVPSPNSMFQNINKLPPASFAMLKNGKLTIRQYWTLENIKRKNYSFNEAARKLLSLMEDSIRTQLISDVPLGAFLSGGVDSSAIVALMAKYSSSKVKTFSVGFGNRKFDESVYAKKVSRLIGTEHFSTIFAPKDMIQALNKVGDELDEPMADPSILPTYMLSQFAKKQVTVALSGDGGDELFAGYPTYFAQIYSQFLSFFPQKLIKGLTPFLIKAAPMVPLMAHSPNLSITFKTKRFLEGLDRNMAKRYLNFMGSCNLPTKQILFTSQAANQIGPEDPAVIAATNLIEKAIHFDRQKQLQFLDLKLYLGEDGLVKTDRASSYNSLEVRVPFLTPEIAEFAFSLPGAYHFNGITLKRLLKFAVKDLLPEDIINRPKKGFGIPTGDWLKTHLRPITSSYLNKEKLKKQGLFRPEAADQLFKKHLHGEEDNRMVLWSLLVFQIWWEKWFNKL